MSGYTGKFLTLILCAFIMLKKKYIENMLAEPVSFIVCKNFTENNNMQKGHKLGKKRFATLQRLTLKWIDELLTKNMEILEI